ncbi:hypothetical protein KAU11_07685 [Candidatus Babeliales bacterium]|nr:hypothetical protein [Candidatus Babeliales bacterium]
MCKYSKDFNFFNKNQIGIVTTNGGKHIKFFSRLNGQVFKKVDDNKIMSDDSILENIIKIHSKLEYYD